jgi:hypothetical protein
MSLPRVFSLVFSPDVFFACHSSETSFVTALRSGLLTSPGSFPVSSASAAVRELVERSALSADRAAMTSRLRPRLTLVALWSRSAGVSAIFLAD